MMMSSQMDATPMDLSDPAPAISNIDIPPELLTLTILKFLPIPSVVSLAKTCRALRAVAAADEVWAKLLARVFPDVTALPPKPTKISTFAALAEIARMGINQYAQVGGRYSVNGSVLPATTRCCCPTATAARASRRARASSFPTIQTVPYRSASAGYTGFDLARRTSTPASRR